MGENYGLQARSFKVQRPKNVEPELLHASVTIAKTGEPSHVSAKTTTAKENSEPRKSRLIYVSLKAFGVGELYHSQRHLIRLWVLLDYFPERFPSSSTPSASLSPALERVISDELRAYIMWVLEPITAEPIEMNTQIDGVTGKITKKTRDLWETSLTNQFSNRKYSKGIVEKILDAHGLIVANPTSDDHNESITNRETLDSVTNNSYCYLADVNAFAGRITSNHINEALSSTSQLVMAASAHYSRELIVPARSQNEQIAFDLQQEAINTLHKNALSDCYKILEDQHEKQLQQRILVERKMKAWLIHALEHPDSIFIPVRVWGGAKIEGPNIDYMLEEIEMKGQHHNNNLTKGKLLGASFLSSLDPKASATLSYVRAGFRWRLAFNLLLYPELRRDRKHYLRLNSFTPDKPPISPQK